MRIFLVIEDVMADGRLVTYRKALNSQELDKAKCDKEILYQEYCELMQNVIRFKQQYPKYPKKG